MEYGKENYTRQRERCQEWLRIFHYHCPNKIGILRGKLTTQKSNFLAHKHFTEEEIEKIRGEVEVMVRNNKCPLRSLWDCHGTTVRQQQLKPGKDQHRQNLRSPRRQCKQDTGGDTRKDQPGRHHRNPRAPPLQAPARAQKTQAALREEMDAALHPGG